MEYPRRSIAIVGFPGTGKTVLKKQLDEADLTAHFRFVKLPGVVMLGRNTGGEIETYDYLLGRNQKAKRETPFGIIALADASELSRQLYLVFQLIDLRLPLLLYLTGEEKATANGLFIDVKRLASLIGVRVVSTAEGTSAVVEGLAAWLEPAGEQVKKQPVHWRPSAALADAYQHLDSRWSYKHLRLYAGARLIEGLRLLGVPRAVEEYEAHPAYELLVQHLEEARKILEDRNERWTMAEVMQRNNWITQVVNASVIKSERGASMDGQLNWWRSLFGK